MKRILIIEDDKSIAELERDYLEINGFAVEIASDGTKGLDKVNRKEYDLVLLDLMLPGVDGYTLCKKIRETKEIPVIMVTAKTADIDKIRGLGLGADDYMTKPFSPQELVARVKSHIARYERLTKVKPLEDGGIKIGELSINDRSREVILGGEMISLTAKEFDLLFFLASNPGIVFSKERLFERLWDAAALGEIATVAVHIGRIREKIEKDPSKLQFIETVWGVGYRFRKK
ncbi:response regulator transcription factor [Gottschalkiaceae bacterium SANA]|nr:response regulator transcription factor [Gottschalkiaceae bacterium SANA]